MGRGRLHPSPVVTDEENPGMGTVKGATLLEKA